MQVRRDYSVAAFCNVDGELVYAPGLVPVVPVAARNGIRTLFVAPVDVEAMSVAAQNAGMSVKAIELAEELLVEEVFEL